MASTASYRVDVVGHGNDIITFILDMATVNPQMMASAIFNRAQLAHANFCGDLCPFPNSAPMKDIYAAKIRNRFAPSAKHNTDHWCGPYALYDPRLSRLHLDDFVEPFEDDGTRPVAFFVIYPGIPAKHIPPYLIDTSGTDLQPVASTDHWFLVQRDQQPPDTRYLLQRNMERLRIDYALTVPGSLVNVPRDALAQVADSAQAVLHACPPGAPRFAAATLALWRQSEPAPYQQPAFRCLSTQLPPPSRSHSIHLDFSFFEFPRRYLFVADIQTRFAGHLFLQMESFLSQRWRNGSTTSIRGMIDSECPSKWLVGCFLAQVERIFKGQPGTKICFVIEGLEAVVDEARKCAMAMGADVDAAVGEAVVMVRTLLLEPLHYTANRLPRDKANVDYHIVLCSDDPLPWLLHLQLGQEQQFGPALACQNARIVGLRPDDLPGLIAAFLGVQDQPAAEFAACLLAVLPALTFSTDAEGALQPDSLDCEVTIQCLAEIRGHPAISSLPDLRKRVTETVSAQANCELDHRLQGLAIRLIRSHHRTATLDALSAVAGGSTIAARPWTRDRYIESDASLSTERVAGELLTLGLLAPLTNNVAEKGIADCAASSKRLAGTISLFVSEVKRLTPTTRPPRSLWSPIAANIHTAIDKSLTWRYPLSAWRTFPYCERILHNDVTKLDRQIHLSEPDLITSHSLPEVHVITSWGPGIIDQFRHDPTVRIVDVVEWKNWPLRHVVHATLFLLGEIPRVISTAELDAHVPSFLARLLVTQPPHDCQPIDRPPAQGGLPTGAPQPIPLDKLAYFRKDWSKPNAPRVLFRLRDLLDDKKDGFPRLERYHKAVVSRVGITDERIVWEPKGGKTLVRGAFCIAIAGSALPIIKTVKECWVEGQPIIGKVTPFQPDTPAVIANITQYIKEVKYSAEPPRTA